MFEKAKSLFLYLISSTSVYSRRVSVRSRPVVGILSQPNHDRDYDYIAASYVKWLESAGARSIVIPYEADDALLEEVFSQINGVLFPGGNADLPLRSGTIWKLILQRNAEEDAYFPVWGTCLGFEFLVMLTGGEDVLQSGFDSENISLPLIFPSDDDAINSNSVYSVKSDLYPVSSSLRKNLVSSNITMNNHRRGITPSKFLNSSNLTDFFHITSTNVDKKGRPFVSTIESKLYPIWGVQYHPEKNNFEFGLMNDDSSSANIYDQPYEAINHSEEAVELSIQLALFFVDQVRHSSHGNYNMTKRHPVVYQYPMITGRGFEQSFIIPKAQHWKEQKYILESNAQLFVKEGMTSIFFLCFVFILFIVHFNFHGRCHKRGNYHGVSIQISYL